jgi:CHAT domain-containing protein
MPKFGETLSATLSYEQYRDLPSATESGPSAPELLLGRAAVHLAAGEPRGTLELLAQLASRTEAPPDVLLRASALRTLSHYWDANLFPDRNGAGGSALDAPQKELRDAEGRAVDERRRLRPLVSDAAARLDAQVLVEALASVQSVRAIIAAAAGTRLDELSTPTVASKIADLSWLRDEVTRVIGVNSLAAYFDYLAADVAYRAGESGDAQTFLTRADQTYRELGDRAGEASCQLLRGDWQAGWRLASPAVWNFRIADSASQGSDLPWAIEEQEFDRAQEELSAASVAYDRAEALFNTGGSHRGLAAVRLRRCYAALVAGDAGAALLHATVAQEEFEAGGDSLGTWLARMQVSLIGIWQGELQDHIATARAVGTWGRSVGSFSFALGLGLFASRVGRYCLRRRGDYTAAIACYRMAAALFQELGAAQNYAQAIVDQGNVLRAVGDRNAALTLYDQALQCVGDKRIAITGAHETPSERELLLAYDMYDVSLQAKDPDRMERFAERMAALVGVDSSSGVQSDDIAKAIRASLLQLMGSNAGASVAMGLSRFAVGRLLSEAVNTARVLIPCYRAERALDADRQGDARALFDQATHALAQLPPTERDLYGAIVLAHQRHFEAAAAAYRRYRARQQQSASGGLATDLLALMRHAGGESANGEQRRHLEHQLEHAAMFYTRVKAYGEAKAQYEELDRIAGPQWWRRTEAPWEIMADLGEIEEHLGNPERALELYDRGIVEIERRRGLLSLDELKTSFAGSRGTQALYFQAARAAARMAVRETLGSREVMTARVVGYAEAAKARGLLDLVTQSAGLDRPHSKEPDPVREWRRHSSQLGVWRGLLARELARPMSAGPDAASVADLRRRIATEERAIEQLEEQLRLANPAFHRSLTQATVQSVASLSPQLEPDTAVLQYFFFDEDFLAWTITTRGVEVLEHQAVGRRELLHLVEALHGACSNRGPWESHAEALAERMLEPFDSVIEAHDQIIIVPYGVAHELPYHVLPWHGQPLGLVRTVSYLPSASVLPLTRRPAPPLSRALAVGNPQEMSYVQSLGDTREPLKPLRSAELEATYVADLFGSEEGLLTGAAATRTAVLTRIRDFPVLHFATHGIMSRDVPLMSSIALAKGEQLTALELGSLRLDASLVVLSACQTGRGELTPGDDVLGLVRGVLSTGARRAVVTLWTVDDDSTALLMARFYERLRANVSAPRALREAQEYLRSLPPDAKHAELARLRAGAGAESRTGPQNIERDAERDVSRLATQPARDYRHPYYWAPFIVIG